MTAYAMRRLALGQESAYGTPVARTVILGGLTDASFTANHTTQVPEEIGRMGPGGSAVMTQASVSGSLSATATFEHLRYFLSSLFGLATPTGADDEWLYAYTAPTASPESPLYFTAEWGSAGNLYLIPSLRMKTLNIKGAAGELITVDSDVFGKQMQVGGSLTALTPTTPLNVMRMADTTLYLDESDGAVGTTLVAATLIDFELNVDDMGHSKILAGDLYPQAVGVGRWTGTLKLGLEWNAASKAIVDELVAGGVAVKRLIELRTEATESLWSKIQFHGVLTGEPTLWEDRDGNQKVNLEFSGLHSTSLGTWLKILDTVAAATLV